MSLPASTGLNLAPGKVEADPAAAHQVQADAAILPLASGSSPPCASPVSHPQKHSGRHEPPRPDTVAHDELERKNSTSAPGRAGTVRP
jgi:hypothetical protein